ncbi:MBL fold metallo-hydrolase [Halobacteriovorax sp. GB3]|uniref:MBL fold metallo-hydrolase n=1 Tax=Halobacteriovorax sp. GB3 TaxID=2719615 RepID=UPI00235F4664|nr:MBL fold metallo-hydrolase [Halobacteriovorax sp. GB3]MDD0853174.1 MBL fold metallo-hydrolase [Halobacteriovorax sp. GB3]
MNITFIGALGTVTGSKTLIEIEGKKYLIDSGLYQGSDLVQKKNFDALGFEANEIEAIFLTHAHLDHVGLIPLLYKKGFRGKIYATKPTIEISKIILEDSAKIQEHEAREKKTSPLYTIEDAFSCFDLYETISFHKLYKLDNLSFRFLRASHVPGAAGISLYDGSRGESIYFSGDLGRKNDDLHHSYDDLPEVDELVLEGTYGDRLHGADDFLIKMKELIMKAKASNGLLLIPSFALARTQVLIYRLFELMNHAPEYKIPVYVDSPMSTKITELYRTFGDELKISEKDLNKAFEFAHFIEWSKEREKIYRDNEARIVLSASGMATGGRVVDYLERYLKYESTSVLFCGYVSENSLGRELLNGEKVVRVNGHKQRVRAHIDQLHSLSAHADYQEMIDWISKSDKRPRRVYLIHSEQRVRENFKKILMENFDFEVILP